MFTAVAVSTVTAIIERLITAVPFRGGIRRRRKDDALAVFNVEHRQDVLNTVRSEIAFDLAEPLMGFDTQDRQSLRVACRHAVLRGSA